MLQLHYSPTDTETLTAVYTHSGLCLSKVLKLLEKLNIHDTDGNSLDALLLQASYLQITCN